MDDIDADVRQLFDSLQSLGKGAAVGNGQLRERLGWGQRGRYAKARDTLVAAGVIRILPGGKGGRVTLVSPKLPDDGTLDVASERGLYLRLVATLHDVLAKGDPTTAEDDVAGEHVAVAVTGDMGKAATGGRYSRPDLIGVVRRTFRAFDALDVHSFEVKPYWSADRVGVFEAVAQRALGGATHSWVVLYLPDESVALRPDARDQVEAARERLRHIERDVGNFGLGLVEFRNTGPQGYDTPRHPVRHPADPERLHELLETAAPDLLRQVGVEPGAAVAM